MTFSTHVRKVTREPLVSALLPNLFRATYKPQISGLCHFRRPASVDKTDLVYPAIRPDRHLG
jgi:hypothetical protein